MPTRVVIAEDEAIIRLDLKETLEEEGYEIVGETGRGDEAVQMVRDLEPDLAILDIKMPGLDGLSAAREITAERQAAVLILTAFSQRDLIEQARDAGALAYLVKPFQRSELVPAIEVALGRFKEHKALHDTATNLEEQLETRKVVERARDAGALAYLVKPFQKADLFPAIEVALGRFQELKALHDQATSLEEQLESRKAVDQAMAHLFKGTSQADLEVVQRVLDQVRLRADPANPAD